MAINYKDFGNKLQNTREKFRAAVIEEQITPTDERERFFSSEVFSVGKTVLVEGVIHEIVDKRSNYVALINESGEIIKKFPTDLIPTKNKISFKPGTYKGVNIPAGFEKVVSESVVKDPIGMIKAFDHFALKNYVAIYEKVENVGIDLQALMEATRADQLQALHIVSDAVGIFLSSKEPQAQVSELIRKVNQEHISRDQRKIFENMLQMLEKLGLKTKDTVKESVFKYGLKTDDPASHLVDDTEPEEEPRMKNRTKIGSTLAKGHVARLMRVRSLLHPDSLPAVDPGP